MENLNVTQKLIRSHLVSGHMNPQEEIGIKIDQTLTQDATGTLVMLELEAMGLNRAKTEISVQYVDHNLIQEDHKNADDHLYLLSACQKYGIWFSRPGNGVSHPIHQEKFGKPGKTLLGSDSHTPAAGAIGFITDPRSLKMIYPELKNPANEQKNVMESLFDPPLDLKESQQIQLRKGPNITNLPKLSPCLDLFNSEVLLKLGDDISTDTIMPAGLHVLPFRSNIQKISEFAFEDLSEAQYFQRATKTRETTGHLIVAGWNYGQGSSREHAALALRYLGLHAVFALSFARIHRQNLINFGVLPFQFENESDYKKISVGDHLEVFNIQSSLRNVTPIFVSNVNKNETYKVTHELSTRQIDIFLQGGIVNWLKNRMSANNVLKAKAELARLESKSGGVL